MQLSRLTSTAFCALVSLLSASPGWAQDASKLQRTALGILNDAHKNEGKEVVLDCAYVRPWSRHSGIPDAAKAQGLEVYLAIDEKNDAIPVIIRLGDGNALIKQFGSEEEYLRGYGTRTRKLRGVVAPWEEKRLSDYRHYLRYEGAKQWVNSESARHGATRQSKKEGQRPQKEKVAFDERPLSSFSYDGKRLIEARVVDVGPEGVVVTSKDSTSVIVPLERAIRMPDLRMRAKDAMEAALAAATADE
jgi:hypothetical protein